MSEQGREANEDARPQPEPDGQQPPQTAALPLDAEPRIIKCVVWDLDETLWDGVLLEDVNVRMRERVAAQIRALDERGILQSIASKNDYDAAMMKLTEFGLSEFFLYPQINWNSKAASIEKIAQAINIGLDAVAFIDDQLFEREEVAFSLPQALCLDAARLDCLLDMPEMQPRFITDDSRNRRLMYMSDIERQRREDEFVGPKEEFLASLGMVLRLGPAREEDLRRAEELTVRTHQLNTTGRAYSYDELAQLCQSPQHKLWMAGLDDKFGAYGKIGLALVEIEDGTWTIKLLLMSCRVMTRGVGSAFLVFLLRQAAAANVKLRADFVSNGRNRMMYMTYKFAGFREVARQGEACLLEHDLTRLAPYPHYLNVEVIS
jgi:FkbH-like protein